MPQLKNEPTAVVSAQIPWSLRKQLIDLAHANERRLSAEIRLALTSHIERNAT